MAYLCLSHTSRGGRAVFGRHKASQSKAWIVARFPRVAMLGLGCFCLGLVETNTYRL